MGIIIKIDIIYYLYSNSLATLYFINQSIKIECTIPPGTRAVYVVQCRTKSKVAKRQLIYNVQYVRELVLINSAKIVCG